MVEEISKKEEVRRKKISFSLVGNTRTLGHKQSEETKEKRRESAKKEEESHSWKGGRRKYRDVFILKGKEKEAGRKRPEQCELCGGGGKINFDHNHKTGKFRGWICTKCNLAFGLVKDDTNLLELMIKYLNENN